MWPNFIYSSVSGVTDNIGCATVCRLHEGPCHLFYQTGSDCYVGRFDYLLGGFLPDTDDTFYMMASKYCRKISAI